MSGWVPQWDGWEVVQVEGEVHGWPEVVTYRLPDGRTGVARLKRDSMTVEYDIVVPAEQDDRGA